MSNMTRGNNFLSGFGNEDYLGEFVMGKSNSQAPNTFVFENDEEYRIEMTVPGFEKDELVLKLDSSQLYVSGKKKNVHNDGRSNGEPKWLKSGYAMLKQWFNIPDNVNRLGINAKFDKGMLEIILPKKADSEVGISMVKVH